MKEINLFIILLTCSINSNKVNRLKNSYLINNQEIHMGNETSLARYDIDSSYENFNYETINFDRNININSKNIYHGNIICGFPFNIQTCKDEIHIMAESLIDTKLTNDFVRTESAYFTISLLYINKFHTNNISNLLESIKLSELIYYPYILNSNVSCIKIESNKNKFISICLNNEEEIKSLLKALDFYFSCNIINIKSKNDKKVNIVTLNKSIADIENKFITEQDEKSVYNIKIKSIFDKEPL